MKNSALSILMLAFLLLPAWGSAKAGQLNINLEGKIQKHCELSIISLKDAKQKAYSQIERTCNIPHNIEISLNKKHKTELNIQFAGKTHTIKPGKRIFVTSEPVANKIDRLSVIGAADNTNAQKGLAQLHINIVSL